MNTHLKYYMGIDPGLSGAIAIYAHGGLFAPDVLIVDDMPLLHHGVKSNSNKLVRMTRRKIDLSRMAELFRYYAEKYPIEVCLLETPHTMPTDGIVGAFTFGQTLGQIQATLACFGITTLPIKPSVWKHILGLSKSKDQSLQAAREDFPNHLEYFTRKVDNGRAEAALLAKLASDRFSDKNTLPAGADED